MAAKYIREGFVDSEAVCGLTDWSFRVYTLLLVRCDDAGRLDGRLEILRSHLFPLGTPRRTIDLSKAIEELQAARLVILYEFSGKPFIQIVKHSPKGNEKVSYYPWKDGTHVIDCVVLPCRSKTGARKFVKTSLIDGIEMGSKSHQDGVDMGSTPHKDGIDMGFDKEREREEGQGKGKREEGDGGLAGFSTFWKSIPAKSRDRSSRKEALAQWKASGCESRTADVLAGLARWMTSQQWTSDEGKYITGAHRWLKAEKWTEFPEQADTEDVGTPPDIIQADRDFIVGIENMPARKDPILERAHQRETGGGSK